jgi:hypothetical protein
MKSIATVGPNLVRSSRAARPAAALLAVLMIALTIPASADTVGISNGTLIVAAEPGDGNQVFAPTIVGLNLVLSLDADIVTPGCTGVGSILCALAGFQELVILGGDGDDVIDLGGISGHSFPVTALGGPGNDVLVGTPGNSGCSAALETTCCLSCLGTASPAELAPILQSEADAMPVPNRSSHRCPDRRPRHPSLKDSSCSEPYWLASPRSAGLHPDAVR